MGEFVPKKLIEIISFILGVNPVKVVPEAKFMADLGADSLDMTELVMALEDEYGIEEIPDEDAEKIVTVGDAMKYLEEHPKPQEVPRCPVAQQLEKGQHQEKDQLRPGWTK